MKFVVDTNELFSFFNKNSKARDLSLLPGLELHSPSFSLEELKEHKLEILKRFFLSEIQYTLVEELLITVVKFSKEEGYSKFIPEARRISPDPDDADFFALALKLNCAIWSEDKLLKKQDKVRVYSTSELLKEV